MYVQDDISEPTGIVFVTVRHQRFEMLLQIGSLMRDRLAFFVGIGVGVVALDLFGYSVIARSIEVCSDESNTCSGHPSRIERGKLPAAAARNTGSCHLDAEIVGIFDQTVRHVD